MNKKSSKRKQYKVEKERYEGEIKDMIKKSNQKLTDKKQIVTKNNIQNVRDSNYASQNAITLVALVITIIVLLILAGISIKLILENGGLLKRAEDATNVWKKAELDEQEEMKNFENTAFNGIGSKGENKSITEITGNETENTEAIDKYGNKIIIPAGFKVVNPEDDITKGIIIEDESANDETSKGNQYVWIPVTHVNGEKINTIIDENKNEHTIELARYTFNSDGTVATKVTDGTSIASCTEETKEEHKKSNTVAKDINKFKESVKKNGGYYIARYEASLINSIPIFKEDQTVINWKTEPEAASLVGNLYSTQGDNYISDLVNSYTWDTTIIFIQEFSGNSSYSQNKGESSLQNTGKSTDVVCNIFDLAGNLSEWTTETCTANYGTVFRGGSSAVGMYSSGGKVCDRSLGNGPGSILVKVGFRRYLIYF